MSKATRRSTTCIREPEVRSREMAWPSTCSDEEKEGRGGAAQSRASRSDEQPGVRERGHGEA